MLLRDRSWPAAALAQPSPLDPNEPFPVALARASADMSKPHRSDPGNFSAKSESLLEALQFREAIQFYMPDLR